MKKGFDLVYADCLDYMFNGGYTEMRFEQSMDRYDGFYKKIRREKFLSLFFYVNI